jgi:isopenicillin N synthase-like dioxygenase
MIPNINVSSLFAGPSPARRATDDAIMAAAAGSGFMTVSGLEGHVPSGREARAELLRIFSLSDAEKRKLYRRKFDAARPNVYHGWFPLQTGGMTWKEGIDMGPDVAHPDFAVDPDDPLTEATPLPEESVLPGWRTAVTTYYRGMERLGAVMMQSIARGLGLPEATFDPYFRGGISTLRLIHYPVRTEASFAGADEQRVWVEHKGQRWYTIGGAHVDSGFVTLLAQDGVEGLQAKSATGEWIDVPPVEGSLAVNFGGLLEKWTAGRIKATEHRVIGPGRQRCSIPFFYEPRVDARIAPLAMPGAAAFAPFLYGDHLWSSMMKFIEFHGLEHVRKPGGKAA